MGRRTAYYLLLVVLVSSWCSAILLAPAVKHSGVAGRAISSSFYSLFERVCHQRDDRSFHLGGEKLGVCIRCASIYFSFLAGLLLLPLFRRMDTISFPTWKVFALSLLPMAFDAALNDLGAVQSTTVTRVATGTLLGLVLPLYILPVYLEACLQLAARWRSGSRFTLT